MPATKKRPPMEIEPEVEEQRESEGIREGEEDMPVRKASRKRSAKGAKNTKAPMDGGMYGKKPMDGEGCGCGRRKGKCDGTCGKKMDSWCIGEKGTELLNQRLDLKCGKGAISKGEKCHKGPASSVQLQAAKKAAGSVSASRPVTVSSYGKGPSALVRAGQAAKSVGRFGLETVKWTSGYNIGKTIASGVTQGKNEKGSTGAKVGSIAGSALLINPIAGLGAARRTGAFGLTDLQQHALNEKKEKKWRKSVGYRDGGTYAKGFKVDYAQLAL